VATNKQVFRIGKLFLKLQKVTHFHEIFTKILFPIFPSATSKTTMRKYKQRSRNTSKQSSSKSKAK
jgi:hypothetical protein